MKTQREADAHQISEQDVAVVLYTMCIMRWLIDVPQSQSLPMPHELLIQKQTANRSILNPKKAGANLFKFRPKFQTQIYALHS